MLTAHMGDAGFGFVKLSEAMAQWKSRRQQTWNWMDFLDLQLPKEWLQEHDPTVGGVPLVTGKCVPVPDTSVWARATVMPRPTWWPAEWGREEQPPLPLSTTGP